MNGSLLKESTPAALELNLFAHENGHNRPTAIDDLLLSASAGSGWVAGSPCCLPMNHLKLSAREIHLWSASVSHCLPQITKLWNTLNSAERNRAERFRRSADWERYVVTRGILRVILSRYLDVPPKLITFSYGQWGKPVLVHPHHLGDLRFNVAHSGDVALLAFTKAGDVGVDVELIPTEIEWETIAMNNFSPAEVRSLRELPETIRHEGFIACWTRKEALVKAEGRGLALPLDGFQVSVDPRKPAVLLRTDCDLEASCRWHLQDVLFNNGYRGCLAINCRELESISIRTYDWIT